MAEKVAIILAAGISSRMNTRLPKVLHEVCGRPMLAYVLDACRTAGVEKLFVVVGYEKEQVIDAFKDDRNITWIEQREQKGTGHAVLCCKEQLKDFKGETLILCGDGPLIRFETLETLISKHESEKAAATLATALLENPAGYGRIVRDSYGNMQGIIEHNDCTPQQLAIKEVNPSYYCFDNQVLFAALDKIKPNNKKNEYYLTDAIHLIIGQGRKVVAVTAVPPSDALSINSRVQLSETSKIMQQRIQDKLMNSGVTIVDPPNTWIDARAKIGQDTIIEPFTYIHGEVTIGSNCRIGPFAYVREGATLGNHITLGVFTEIKNSTLADRVRARHLSYIGDANVGENVNIAAGFITADFDGQKVNHTEIGKDSFIGSGSILVAPLEIKPGTHIGPGSVVSSEKAKQTGHGGSK